MEGVGQTGGQTFQVNGRVEGVREEVGTGIFHIWKLKKNISNDSMHAVNQYKVETVYVKRCDKSSKWLMNEAELTVFSQNV